MGAPEHWSIDDEGIAYGPGGVEAYLAADGSLAVDPGIAENARMEPRTRYVPLDVIDRLRAATAAPANPHNPVPNDAA